MTNRLEILVVFLRTDSGGYLLLGTLWMDALSDFSDMVFWGSKMLYTGIAGVTYIKAVFLLYCFDSTELSLIASVFMETRGFYYTRYSVYEPYYHTLLVS